MEQVLLTGASGFVGQHVQAAIACVPFEDVDGEVDLRDEKRVQAAIIDIKPDAVMHLAAQSFVPRSFEDPAETFDINFLGTFNLLTALKDTGFTGRFLFVGTGDAYGLVNPDQLPIHEEMPLRPRNPYAVSKVAAEALCYQWSQIEDFDVMMTRSFNHIGPGQSNRFVISSFAQQIAEVVIGKRKPILKVGDIDVSRDFTDVRDVVKAYQSIIERGQNGEIYNVCSGTEYSVRDLLRRMLELAHVEITVVKDPNRMRKAEQRRVVGSPAKLHEHTGWKPTIDMAQSLKDILTYWKETIL